MRLVFDSGARAWNNGDIDTYLDSYHDSDELRIVYNTMIMRGKQAIVDMNKLHFASSEAMGQLSVSHVEVELIGDMDALVFGLFERTGGARPVKATFTAHLRKINGAWRILSEHGAV